MGVKRALDFAEWVSAPGGAVRSNAPHTVLRVALRAAPANAAAQKITVITTDGSNAGTGPAAAGCARYKQRRKAAMP